jgi:hypothetical protein
VLESCPSIYKKSANRWQSNHATEIVASLSNFTAESALQIQYVVYSRFSGGVPSLVSRLAPTHRNQHTGRKRLFPASNVFREIFSTAFFLMTAAYVSGRSSLFPEFLCVPRAWLFLNRLRRSFSAWAAALRSRHRSRWAMMDSARFAATD